MKDCRNFVLEKAASPQQPRRRSQLLRCCQNRSFGFRIIVARYNINPKFTFETGRTTIVCKVSAKLKISEPTGNVWDLDLVSGSTYTIGRAKENDIVLNDRRVSRKHARIEPFGPGFRLVDGSIENGSLVRSVNHVFVNGSPTLEKDLADGDSIVIGESILAFSVA